MKNEQTGPKLSGEKQKYRIEICKMLATGFSPALVSQEMKDRFGITISRQSIYKDYKVNPTRKKLIEYLRARMAKELMKHPLADKRNRLNYLLRALDHALVWGTDRLYFDKDGKLVGKVEKVQLGVIASLIKEAREEIEGYKSVGLPEVKVSLLQIIKEATDGNGRFNIRTETKVDRNIPVPANPMDSKDSGDIEIL